MVIVSYAYLHLEIGEFIAMFYLLIGKDFTLEIFKEQSKMYVLLH